MIDPLWINPLTTPGRVVTQGSYKSKGEEQGGYQTLMTKIVFGASLMQTLEPATYRGDKKCATTFGVRVNKDWKFYYVSYRKSGGSPTNPPYEHYGVFDFNGIAI